MCCITFNEFKTKISVEAIAKFCSLQTDTKFIIPNPKIVLYKLYKLNLPSQLWNFFDFLEQNFTFQIVNPLMI